MKVFISWSGPRSKAVAEALSERANHHGDVGGQCVGVRSSREPLMRAILQQPFATDHFAASSSVIAQVNSFQRLVRASCATQCQVMVGGFGSMPPL
jgi:hypothetical protein